MGNFSATLASGKKDNVALFQIMYGYFLPHFALLCGSAGQVHTGTLERKENQGGAIYSRAGGTAIPIRGPSKGCGRFHSSVNPFVLDLSSG